MTKMAWAVPQAKPLSPIMNLILPFQKSGWMSVLLTLVLAWMVGRLFARLSSSRAFLDAVSTLLGVSSSSLQSAPKFAVLGLRLGCLILTAAYQTKLASILTIPVYESELETPAKVSKFEQSYLLFNVGGLGKKSVFKAKSRLKSLKFDLKMSKKSIIFYLYLIIST